MIFSEDSIKGNLSGNELKRYRLKKKILNLLYKHNSLSGSTISNRIGVSLPTAMNLLNELTQLDFIEIYGTGASRGGRKPNLYRLTNQSVYVIACELDQHKGKITIYNAHNQLVTPIAHFDTNIDDPELVDKICNHVNILIQENGIENNRIFGIGLTMPGLVDELHGVNHTIKNPEFQNVRERLQNKFDYMVYINNDARMQAYGEYVFGKAKGHENAIIFNWSWGIGLGMILNGKLYNGSFGFAGEISHAKFVEDGELCVCGKRGCLETIASATVLVSMARSGIKSGVVTQLTKKFENRLNDMQPADIINAAKKGDEFSISLLNKLGLALGKGIALTIQLLNPDIVVLGGIIANADHFILTPVQQSIYKHCLEQISTSVKIVISENWEQSGLLGVAAMLFQELFSDLNSKSKYEFV